MAQVELIMPKMGESIMEATILKWVKNVGDTVEEDETILEIATDKVDSEVPSPVSGTIKEVFFKENDTVEIGKVIAVIATEGEAVEPKDTPSVREESSTTPVYSGNGHSNGHESTPKPQPEPVPATAEIERSGPGGRFYSPLVRTIAEKEQISQEELEHIEGSGMPGRVTKKDILAYV